MKKIILALILVSNMATSCSQEKLIISNDGVGEIKLGELLIEKPDIKGLEIITNKDNVIQLIKLTSNNYRTKEGFGVGSNFNQIEKTYKKTMRKSLGSTKGNIIIGNLGEIIVYENISFVDNNNDNKVDTVWVQQFVINKH
ncbi:hypothetical protein [uncultured Algibacter sp.]|uniref:hypothetical protein n=1 Tax=uncultured Algibacter sp. TaxID=298659 RepID=UPI0026246344|nr:hypothetical protein [uncultured Algibacter sp.]